MSVFAELKRRNVFKVGIAYVVIAWVLIQVADTAFPAFGAPEWALRVFILFIALGFPVALILAWALELTSEGVRKAGGRNAPIYILALALAAAAVYWFMSGNGPVPPTNSPAPAEEPAPGPAAADSRSSIAILPFENMSGDDSNLPFTMGIHDDLLTQVSKINSLRTISRTSVLQYRDSDRTIPEIARELGVSAVLEGGVQRIGDHVRINVQLIDAGTDEHLWAETYDRELTAANVFAIQSEIATSIADALHATLTDQDQQRLASTPTGNLGALDAYFMGKQLIDIRSEENIRESIRFFDLAISLDPGFALAHAARSTAWLLMPEYDADIDVELVRGNALDSAERALALDPNLPEGLTVQGWIRLTQHYDWEGAEASLRRALEVHATNLEALHWLSHVLSWQGRHDEALTVAQRAVDIDPFSPLMLMNLSYIQMDARLYEDSLKTRDRTLQVKSDMHEQMRNMWLTYLRAGRYEEAKGALRSWAQGTGRDTDAAQQLGMMLAQHDATGRMVALPGEILDSLELGAENLGQVYAAAGDRENALAVLEEAVAERAGSRSVLSMKINPLYDFIRDDPRFIAMLQEVNLAP